MSNFPVRAGTTDLTATPTGRQLAKAQRAATAAELEIFRHALGARVRSEIDRLDSQAVADALEASMDVEFDLLDYGLRRAGGSAAKAAIVAGKVEMLNNINNRRIARRFGGD